MRRSIIIVLDSFGIGKMPDHAKFNDKNPDTMGHIYSKTGGLNVPNMYRMGLSHIDGVSIPNMCDNPTATYCRLKEKSMGKDTVTGHWELMGIESKSGFKIYENGFPRDFMEKTEKAWGRKTLFNAPASGTEIIQRYGSEHLKTGSPIIYTSADSVFQVAAHEGIIPLDELYDMCILARRLADEENMGIGRIIARPFTGDETHGFVRTENRRDYSVEPPQETILDIAYKKGYRTLAIGKIEDIFAHRGITLSDHSKNNVEGIDATISHMKNCDSDFIFTNLVDFDMLYGHRRDAEGYRQALEYFDFRLPEILDLMTDDDLLILTADHGCDPTADGTDHTREYVPCLMKYGKSTENKNLGTIDGFDFVGKTALEWIMN